MVKKKYLKKILYLLGALLILSALKIDVCAAKAKSLTYNAYPSEGEKNNKIAETKIQIKEISDDQTSISRQKQAKN